MYAEQAWGGMRHLGGMRHACPAFGVAQLGSGVMCIPAALRGDTGISF